MQLSSATPYLLSYPNCIIILFHSHVFYDFFVEIPGNLRVCGMFAANKGSGSVDFIFLSRFSCQTVCRNGSGSRSGLLLMLIVFISILSVLNSVFKLSWIISLPTSSSSATQIENAFCGGLIDHVQPYDIIEKREFSQHTQIRFLHLSLQLRENFKYLKCSQKNCFTSEQCHEPHVALMYVRCKCMKEHMYVGMNVCTYLNVFFNCVFIFI